jgi:class 3 adenylate cyclase
MSGAPLPRGTVTFLFSDIEASTDLVRRVGDDVFAAIRGDHRRLLRDAFAERGGREIDTAGDGFFVAFDSARSAVAAAVSAQLALASFTWPADAEIRVRMGLHTAEPTSRRGRICRDRRSPRWAHLRRRSRWSDPRFERDRGHHRGRWVSGR